MFRNFFKDRYGVDTFGIVLVFLALILSRINIVWILGAAVFLYAIYRMLSKDRNKRFQEQQKFNSLLQKFMKIFSREGSFFSKLFKNLQGRYYYSKMIFQQRKQFEFFKCPKCKKNLRLPKNKGRLQVTCPVCKFEFYKNT
jgi:hypothetical protein